MPRTVEQLIDAFFEEWIRTTERVAEAIAAKDFQLLEGDIDQLHHRGPANSINRAGRRLLDEAAAGLLRRERLEAKLSLATARKALVDAFVDHLPKARRTGTLSERAVVQGTRRTLRTHPRDDGTFIIPVVFAPRASATDFRVGAARLVSRSILDAETADAWTRHERDANDLGRMLAEDWRGQGERADHFIAIEVREFEAAMAWPAAHDAAETMLNLVRMLFGYDAMKGVRLADGFLWQDRRSSLRIDRSGTLHLSSSFGGDGSHLEDGWADRFDHALRGYAPMLASSVTWHVQNDGRRRPTMERLTYFNRLAAEAYSEPHDPIRLVRLVSALEAFAVTGPVDKAHGLAHRCAAAGGWGDPHRYCGIYDAVREAYHWRNAVVHGDSPARGDVLRAFRGLERHLMNIYLGLSALHVGIANSVDPQSIAAVRREIGRRIDLFFWQPSLVT